MILKVKVTGNIFQKCNFLVEAFIKFIKFPIKDHLFDYDNY